MFRGGGRGHSGMNVVEGDVTLSGNHTMRCVGDVLQSCDHCHPNKFNLKKRKENACYPSLGLGNEFCVIKLVQPTFSSHPDWLCHLYGTSEPFLASVGDPVC